MNSAARIAQKIIKGSMNQLLKFCELTAEGKKIAKTKNTKKL